MRRIRLSLKKEAWFSKGDRDEGCRRMNILFLTSEAMPLAKTGGLADVMGSLPKELLKLGVDARVIMPLYKSIKDKHIHALKLIKDFSIALSWREQYCALFKGEFEGITFYFIDNDQYFGRDEFYGYFDDGERFAYFPKAVLDALPHIEDFKPDILHCSEWQTALAPVYLHTLYQDDPFFKGMKTAFTIHNVEYQGKYDPWIGGDILGLEAWDYQYLEYRGALNFMKGAIVTADRVTTVSPSYAQELTYPYYAEGLDPIISEHAGKLVGIRNGIDQDLYNPGKDPLIEKNYTSRSPQRKKDNKRKLQAELGLTEDADVPMIALIGRLVSHKGVDLVQFVLDELMHEDIQFVILGKGDTDYEHHFVQKMKRYQGRFHTHIGFSPDLANKLYASADMFLMPSKSEPCGLTQMIALRYGTIPIVRETGGLKDSIQPFDPDTAEGNGFTFNSYNAHDMLGAVRRALAVYQDGTLWRAIVRNAFASDFGWEKSAVEYINLYKSMLED